MSAPFDHGLIVGKFYPPHAGHLRLVEEAASRCRRVSVVVAAATWETLPLGRRVEWLGWEAARWPHVSIIGVMDDHPVDYGDADVWDAHMAVFARAVAQVAPGQAVDAVFTGEEYGDEMARRLGASHVRLHRTELRPSGTASRDDPAATWQDILPAARAALAHRIVVVGAESTGTTTLARALADHFGAPFVPEFGRTYSAAKLAGARHDAWSTGEPEPALDDLVWTSEEFTLIAARQTAAIERAGIEAPVVVADTDALATSVWHDRYVGGRHGPALELADRVPADLYLMTLPGGVPFVDDGLRDGEHIRGRMTGAFEEALRSSGRPWSPVTGSHRQRLRTAVGLVDAVVSRSRFAVCGSASDGKRTKADEGAGG